ncbi:MAG: electron transfer flavoprotein subunit beta/FixA family protein [bacterium]
MNIVVCIKQVPDTTEIRLDPTTGTLIRDGVPSIINPDDKGGLELALQLKERYNAHITAITMGPLQADVALREALAMGVDRAILLTDRKFAGADTLATSSALSGALRNIDYDIIITGRQAIDGDTAQVGPQIAEELDIAQISYVEYAAKSIDGSKYVVRKWTEEGHEILEVDTNHKLLLTVLASGLIPRYMRVKGIVEAYDREVELWGFDNITVDEKSLGLKGSPTRVKKSFTKGVKPVGAIHEVEPAEAVEIIINKLKEKFVI